MFTPVKSKLSFTRIRRFAKLRSSEYPDPKWGELVMACVVPKPGMALTVDELVAHLPAEVSRVTKSRGASSSWTPITQERLRQNIKEGCFVTVSGRMKNGQ